MLKILYSWRGNFSKASRAYAFRCVSFCVAACNRCAAPASTFFSCFSLSLPFNCRFEKLHKNWQETGWQMQKISNRRNYPCTLASAVHTAYGWSTWWISWLVYCRKVKQFQWIIFHFVRFFIAALWWHESKNPLHRALSQCTESMVDDVCEYIWRFS